jgi:O-antigen/teichoic acid export membrane protein
MKVAIGVIASLVLIMLARPVGRTLLHTEAAKVLIMTGCLAAVGLLAMRSVQVHLQVDQRFVAYGGVDLAHSCLRFGGIGLVLLLLPPNPVAIILVVALAPWIVFVISGTTIAGSLSQHSPGLKQAAREVADFVRWPLLTMGVATFGRQVDIWLLGSRASMSEVGIFSGGQVLSAIPDMLGMYLSVVLSPRIMRYLRDGTFCGFFRRVQRTLLIGAGAALIVGLLGVDLVRQYVLPEQYARSALVFAVLWPGALAGTVSFPLAIAFVMFVRPSFLFRLELVILPLTVVAYLVAIDRYGAVGAAWVTTVSRVTKAVIVGVLASRLAQNAKQEFLRQSAPRGAAR